MRYLSQAARLVVDPHSASIAIREQAPFWRSLALAVVASAAYQAALGGFVEDLFSILRLGGFDPGAIAILVDHARTAVPVAVGFVLAITGVLVPLFLFLLGALDRETGVVVTLRREYRGTASAALTAYALAAGLWAVPAWLMGDPQNARAVATWSVLPLVLVALLLAVAAAPVASAGLGRAAGAAATAAAVIALLPFAGWAFAVLVLAAVVAVAVAVARAALVERASISRERESFERALASVAANPYDASAHATLGGAYLRAGDLDSAAAHLRAATDVDPSDVASLYQFGRVARLRGDFGGAIAAFDGVLQIDSDFANGEVWREAGATYLAAGQPSDARSALERFVARRPTNAEGLYLLGRAADALGDQEGARRRMLSVIDVVRSAPAYKHHLEREWLEKAEDFLKGAEPRP